MPRRTRTRRGSRRKLRRKSHRRSRRHSPHRPIKQSGGASPPLLFVLTNNAGFYSVFFFLCNTYILSKDTGAPLYITQENWQYNVKDGWHDYFTTLTALPAEPLNPPPTRYQHSVDIGSRSYPAARYEEAIRDIYKPKQEILDKAEAFIKTIGGPYTSLYVRRGDKVAPGTSEMDKLPLSKILEDCEIKDDGRKLFIQTDDYAMVDEAKKLLPSCQIFTLAKQDEDGAVHAEIKAMTPEQRREHAEQLFIGNAVFLKGNPAWTDGRSNVGRFLKLASFDAVKVYPKGSPGESLTRDKVITPYSSL